LFLSCATVKTTPQKKVQLKTFDDRVLSFEDQSENPYGVMALRADGLKVGKKQMSAVGVSLDAFSPYDVPWMTAELHEGGGGFRVSFPSLTMSKSNKAHVEARWKNEPDLDPMKRAHEFNATQARKRDNKLKYADYYFPDGITCSNSFFNGVKNDLSLEPEYKFAVYKCKMGDQPELERSDPDVNFMMVIDNTIRELDDEEADGGAMAKLGKALEKACTVNP